MKGKKHMKDPLGKALTFFETVYGALTPGHAEQVKKNHQALRTFKAKAHAQRNIVEKTTDFITNITGSITFAVVNIVWFAAWILINLGYVPGIAVFDPYPFGLLTMIVSLEAIVLSIIVLVSQNRETRINDLREEVNFQINMHAEQEITKVLILLKALCEHSGLKKINDNELAKMIEKLDTTEIQEQIEAEVKES